MDCDAIFKGTKVDGVYTADPFKDRKATRFERITYMDVLTKDLKVMDATAISLARENNVPIVIFNIREAGNFARVIKGESKCTVVSNAK
jgi:uridylate kinase